MLGRDANDLLDVPTAIWLDILPDVAGIMNILHPARFGGSALDYQLLEEEDEDGLTRLSLLVHPRNQINDEATIIEFVLDALTQRSSAPGQGSLAAEMTRSIWKQADALRVKRVAPILPGNGKMMPLHVIRTTQSL